MYPPTTYISGQTVVYTEASVNTTAYDEVNDIMYSSSSWGFYSGSVFPLISELGVADTKTIYSIEPFNFVFSDFSVLTTNKYVALPKGFVEPEYNSLFLFALSTAYANYLDYAFISDLYPKLVYGVEEKNI